MKQQEQQKHVKGIKVRKREKGTVRGTSKKEKGKKDHILFPCFASLSPLLSSPPPLSVCLFPPFLSPTSLSLRSGILIQDPNQLPWPLPEGAVQQQSQAEQQFIATSLSPGPVLFAIELGRSSGLLTPNLQAKSMTIPTEPLDLDSSLRVACACGCGHGCEGEGRGRPPNRSRSQYSLTSCSFY